METHFIDSNIFVYARTRDKKYGSACAHILEQVAAGKLPSATSTLAILETSNALKKIGLHSEVVNEVQAIYSLPITVYDLLNVDVRLATKIFGDTQVSPYDCAHAAIMKRTGLRAILSADGRHFDRVPGITRVDPLDFKK